MGVFWDQVRAKLQSLFNRHPELVLWAFEQGPQTNNTEGYAIFQGQVHKMEQSVIPMGIAPWKIFTDVRWLCSDDIDLEHAFIRHKLGLPIQNL